VNKRKEEYLNHVNFERFKRGMSGREGSRCLTGRRRSCSRFVLADRFVNQEMKFLSLYLLHQDAGVA